MTTLQQQARALGDPTRHALFRYLAESALPVGVAELTEHFRLNHNAIRQHLGKLAAADLVVETRVQGGGRGRPRLQYAVNPSSESRWGVVGPYERLSVLLVEMVRSGDSPVDVGRRAGVAYERSPSGNDGAAAVVDAMTRLGFDPDVRTRGNRIDVVLATCPFTVAVLTDRDTVCSLHLGIAQGIVEGTDTVVDDLVAKDPRRAMCRLRLRKATPAA